MRPKILVYFTTLLFLPVIVFSQVQNERITLLNNKASILVPKELSKMTNEMWTSKYQKRPRPILVLTDGNGAVNLIGDITQQAVTESQLESFKNFQLAQLKKSKPDQKVLQEGIKTVSGKKVGYYKFMSGVNGQKVFNYYFFTIVEGKILFFTFNCMENLKATWEKTADQIVASLQTK